jgi:hypothetical protein
LSNLETVKKMYTAFGKGDVPTILGCLSDDVQWEYGGLSEVPWLVPRKGKAGAGEFFQSLAAIEIQKFVPKTILEGDGVVVSLVELEFTVKATGRRVVEEDEVHIWYFGRDGLVSRFRHRVDTFRHEAALYP